jgi:hypothetical protein
MQSIAFVVLEPEPPGIDEDDWIDLIEDHDDLRPERPREGKNPFTGEPITFAGDPRNASLLDPSTGKVLGELRWSMDVPERLELFASPACAQAATAAATDVARELGAILRERSHAWSAEVLLDGVDDIDWSTIDTCAGQGAAHLPDTLRGLLDADPERREDANGGLELAYHQGTLYPAGAHAFPFLLRALAERDIVDRDSFAMWVAIGLQGARLRAFADEGTALDPCAALVAPHAATAIELLTPFLRSSNAAFRGAIADALATAPPDLADDLIPHVERALERETDDEARSQLRHCLMYLRGQGDQVRAEERQRAEALERDNRERNRPMTSPAELLTAIVDLFRRR